MNKMIKKLRTAFVLLSIAAGLSACETDYLAYDTALKEGIYFPTDSLNYQFGMQQGESFEYFIPVSVLGQPVDHDRTFTAQLVPGETTAQPELHYELSHQFVIPAGAVSGQISLVLHRYKDPNLTVEPLVIKFRLIESDDFRLVMDEECELVFSDTELPRPRWWSDWHFGPYSQMLMMDIYNYYWDLEESRPHLFERIVAEYGRNLERALSFPYQQEIAFIKYVITPAYEYYLENPHPRVNLPNPDNLL